MKSFASPLDHDTFRDLMSRTELFRRANRRIATVSATKCRDCYMPGELIGTNRDGVAGYANKTAIRMDWLWAAGRAN
jgi:hypothetical protein